MIILRGSERSDNAAPIIGDADEAWRNDEDVNEQMKM
jgi:hypothetical protein